MSRRPRRSPPRSGATVEVGSKEEVTRFGMRNVSLMGQPSQVGRPPSQHYKGLRRPLLKHYKGLRRPP